MSLLAARNPDDATCVIAPIWKCPQVILRGRVEKRGGLVMGKRGHEEASGQIEGVVFFVLNDSLLLFLMRLVLTVGWRNLRKYYRGE